jgi:hypothetical protein
MRIVLLVIVGAVLVVIVVLGVNAAPPADGGPLIDH